MNAIATSRRAGRFLIALGILLLSGVAASPGTHAAERADVLLTETFGTQASLDRWQNAGPGEAAVVSEDAETVLRVRAADRRGHMIRLPLPIEQIRGYRLTLAGRVKALEVSKPAEPWNGVKLMLHSTGPSGDRYHAVSDLAGSFDWRELGATVPIPADAKAAWIILGLQDSSGTVWFDDVSLTVSAVPRKIPATRPAPLPPEQLDRRTDVPRLRGVMYGPRSREEDLRELASWGGNLIRWQFYWYDGSFAEKRWDLAAYDRWLEQTMADLERHLPLCHELGIRVVVDLHTPPGGNAGNLWPMFRDRAYQEKFIEVWDRLVDRFKDEPAVWAYDLLNEPSEGHVAEGLMDWRTLAEFVGRRVRAADPERAIIVAPGPHGGWENLPYFEPLDVPGIIYTVHLYEPLAFTHQGVLDGYPSGVTYPGEIDGVLWNKDQIRRTLEPVRQFQLDYNVPIYVGEFSAPRWAPGGSAAAYLRDCIAVLEEFGWDWSYHAFREWHGWNVELGPAREDESPSPTPTDRQRVLQSAFSKNRDAAHDR